jgi:hypothetical protein
LTGAFAFAPLPADLRRDARGFAEAFPSSLAGAAGLAAAFLRWAALGCAGVFDDFAI